LRRAFCYDTADNTNETEGTRDMLSRKFAAAALAGLCLTVASASAQTNDQGQAPVSESSAAAFVTTFDCGTAMRPDQTTICSSPQLAAMDLQMQTLYTVVAKFLSDSELADLQAGQKAFLDARAGCGEDFQCIGTGYARRIGQLDTLVTAASEIFKRNMAEDAADAPDSEGAAPEAGKN
jgi:uncharacterized protein